MIEVLVAVAVASTMLGIVVTMIHTLLGAERRVADAVAYRDALHHLETDFRRDAHEARQVQIVQGQLELQQARDQRVVYSAVSGGVLRRKLESDQDTQRRMYRLTPGAQIRFDLLDKSSRVRCEVRRERGFASSRNVTSGDQDQSADGQQTVGVRVIIFESMVGRRHRIDSQ